MVASNLSNIIKRLNELEILFRIVDVYFEIVESDISSINTNNSGALNFNLAESAVLRK